MTETDEKARMERMERHIVKNRVAIDGTLTEIGEKGKGEIKVKMEKIIDAYPAPYSRIAHTTSHHAPPPIPNSRSLQPLPSPAVNIHSPDH